MSGIAGIYHRGGRPVESSVVHRMTGVLTHRGTDAAGELCLGAVGLGHRMRYTTQESLSDVLPRESQDKKLAITADARIDNREELAAALDLNGPSLREISDTELILCAYRKWGERCVDRFLGDFAFAIWNCEQQVLFCARDHFGVKPFYYFCSARVFVFASEIKALFCLEFLPRRLNEMRVAEFLLTELEDQTVTFFLGIERLPPGHALRLDRDSVRKWRYWRLELARELALSSDGEYAEGFREIMTKAVRCRLRSAFSVGTMLSGGLDSSTITCLSRRILAERGVQRLHTFSAVFEDSPACDEWPFISSVLKQDGLLPHFVQAETLNPFVELEHVLWLQDEAFFAPNLFLHWGLYRAASEQGVRVLLDGLDGDTSVSHGIGYLAELARRGAWVRLGREILDLSRRFHHSPWNILLHNAISPLLPQPLRRGLRALLQACKDHSLPNSFVNRDFARRVGVAERVRFLQVNLPIPLRTARQEHLYGLSRGLIPYMLEVADHAASSFGIEPRYPFFDKRLAEYCLALPPEQKIFRGWTRLVMRRAMEGILPPEVQWRGGKADLSPNFIRGMLASQEKLIQRSLQRGSSVIAEYCDLEVLQGTYRRFLTQRAERDALTIWKAVILDAWLRSLGDGPKAAPGVMDQAGSLLSPRDEPTAHPAELNSEFHSEEEIYGSRAR